MTIDSFKDLKKIIDLCRKQGVYSIKVDGIELVLGSAPKAPQAAPVDYNPDPLADAQVPSYNPVPGYSGPSNPLIAHQETAQETASRIAKESGLTEEQLLNWSAVGPTDHMVNEQ